MPLFNDIQNSLKNGFGQSIVRTLPTKLSSAITGGINALGDIQNGNLLGAAERALSASGISIGAGNFNMPTAMLGGLSPQQTLNLYSQHHGIDFCRKNLWLLEVSSALSGENDSFNMYAISADFNPITITGEKKQVGAAHIDTVNSADPVEINLTTLDDVNGSIKQWIEDHAAATVSSDGTVGLPIDYAISIKFTHAYANRLTSSLSNGYQSKGLFRVGNLALSLSRSEQALSELSISFVQLDTFMAGA